MPFRRGAITYRLADDARARCAGWRQSCSRSDQTSEQKRADRCPGAKQGARLELERWWGTGLVPGGSVLPVEGEGGKGSGRSWKGRTAGASVARPAGDSDSAAAAAMLTLSMRGRSVHAAASRLCDVSDPLHCSVLHARGHGGLVQPSCSVRRAGLGGGIGRVGEAVKCRGRSR